MPIMLAGLAAIGRILWSIAPWLVEFFAKWMTRRVAIAAAVVSAFLVLTTAFYAAIYALVAGIAVVAPPYFSQACGLMLPSNTYGCLSAILATYVARWVYDLQLRVLTYSNPGAGF